MEQALRKRRTAHLAPVPYVPESDISLKELVHTLWRGKWIILACAIALGAAATAVGMSKPQLYRASAVVAPVSTLESANDSTSALLSQFSNIAALTGLPLGGSNGRAEAIAILDSSSLVTAYIRQNNLIPLLYPDLWDAAAQRWRVQDKAEIPTLWQASQFFSHNVKSVTEDARTGTLTVTITWTDPALAARWANGLVALTNEYLRGKAIQEAERKIAYLQAEASKTSIVQVQNAIYSLLELQIKNAMLARGTPEYALRVVDAAVPPERPAAPRPLLWTLAGLCTGFFAGALFVLARTAWRASP